MSASPVPAGHHSRAAAAALAGFPRMTVRRLSALLALGGALDAFAVAAGQRSAVAGSVARQMLDGDPDLAASWRAAARDRPPDAVWSDCQRLGIDVSVLGEPGHPDACAEDPLPCPVLFSIGDRELLTRRRVALIGTRNATAVGRHAATTFGRELSLAAVDVVSGLARGIDGDAHRGTLAGVDLGGTGRPIAVVASGLDVVYPSEHRSLWKRVGEEGLLLSEHPPGVAPVAHHFPLRNRLVAGLSEVVVVVESRERGGSLITVDAAAERGVPVMAVPGSITNRAATGVNALLRDGAAPAADVADILIGLGLDHSRQRDGERLRGRPIDPFHAAIVDLVTTEPATVDALASRLGASLHDVAVATTHLDHGGWLTARDGWFERADGPPPVGGSPWQ